MQLPADLQRFQFAPRRPVGSIPGPFARQDDARREFGLRNPLHELQCLRAGCDERAADAVRDGVGGERRAARFAL